MAAVDNLLCYHLMNEATGATRVDGSGSSVDLSDVGAVDFPLHAASDFGDGSIHSSFGEGIRCLQANQSLLQNDFPGKDGGTCLAYTVYLRLRTEISPSGSSRLFWFIGDAAFAGLMCLQQTTTNDRDIMCRHTDESSTHHDITVTVPNHTAFQTVIARWQGDTDDELSVWLDAAKSPTTHTVATAPKTQAVNHLCLGNQKPTSGRVIDGYIDEHAVWARALSDAEIATLTTGGIVAFAGQRAVAIDTLAIMSTLPDVIASAFKLNAERGVIVATEARHFKVAAELRAPAIVAENRFVKPL